MRVFVAGATGAVGKRLVPLLVARGHEVFAVTRSPDKARDLEAAGARAVIADALDGEAMLSAVLAARPDVIVHQLSALANMRSLRRFDDEFAGTNELRTRGTDILLAAARAAGVKRLVAQSYTGWPNERSGGAVKTEDDPLDGKPPRRMRRTLAAIRYLEAAVSGARELEGIVLRYGSFYGPGTSIASGGDIVKAVQKRAFPIVGDGGGVWSFTHIDDAAGATVAAVEHGVGGIYNIVDDDPAPVAEWLPELARAVGAPPPRRVPGWVGWLAVGGPGLAMMTTVRGSANAKAKRALAWQPLHPHWREGFAHAL